jgi:hypothetical protein
MQVLHYVITYQELMTHTDVGDDNSSAASAAEVHRMRKASPASRLFCGLLGWCREGESNPQDPKVGGF